MNSLPSRSWYIVKCVLYELQPFRVIDVIHFTKYASATCMDLAVAGLALSEYIYQLSFNFFTTLKMRTWLYIVAWVSVLLVMHHIEFGSLWVLISMFAGIFMNLGERKRGEMSAYSVFNTGFKQLLGTMNAEQFDNEIRHNMIPRHEADIVGLDDVLLEDSDNSEQENMPRRAPHRQNNRRHPDNLNNNHNNHHNNNNNNNNNNNPDNQNQNQNNNNNAPAAVLMNRKKGKKGRRNYEERMQRRYAAAQLAQQLEGDDFLMNDDAFTDEDNDEF